MKELYQTDEKFFAVLRPEFGVSRVEVIRSLAMISTPTTTTWMKFW